MGRRLVKEVKVEVKKGKTKGKKKLTGEQYLEYLKKGTMYLLAVYLFLLVVILPFYYKEGYAHIGTDKSMFFRYVSLWSGAILVLPVLACVILELVLHKMAWIRKLSVTDYFAVGYTAAVLLSYIKSPKELTGWGDTFYGAYGWYMGLVTQLAMLAIYFLVSRLWRPGKQWGWVLLTVMGIQSVWTIFNRFSAYPGFLPFVNIEFISSIGNMNWLCGYLITVFWAAVYLLWSGRLEKTDKRIQWCYRVFLGLGFSAIVLQGSTSGIFAMALMLVVLFMMSRSEQKKMQYFWELSVILFASCSILQLLRVFKFGPVNALDTMVDLLTYSFLSPVLLCLSGLILWSMKRQKKPYNAKMWNILGVYGCTFALLWLVMYVALLIVNTLNPGSIGTLSVFPAFTFNPYWASNRGMTWMAGLECFADQDLWGKLFGVGPDGMAIALYSGNNFLLLSRLKATFGTLMLTNAHNEWLTILVDYGIFGLITFVGMVCSAIVRFMGNKKNGYAVAAGLCILAYTINNMFSFQQIMGTSMMFLIMGLGEARMRKEKE